MRRATITAAAFMLLGATLLGFAGCSAPPSGWPPGKSPRILASFPPLYCFAKNLVGDDAALLCLLTTTGPHDYQVTPRDAILVGGADVFLTHGLTLDDTFTTRLKNSSGNVKLHFIELGEAVPMAQRRKLSEAEQQGHAGHAHAHGSHDPHVWLGIPEAILMVERLRDELKTVDPGRAADYDRRAKEYVEKLKKLHAEGKEMLAGVKPEDQQLITMHDSAHYFARAFGLTIAACIQPRAGVELDARQMGQLVELCKMKNIRVVAVEPQYPDAAARTLSTEVAKKGVPAPKIVVLDPLETAEKDQLDAGWYERKMRENLKNLADALR